MKDNDSELSETLNKKMSLKDKLFMGDLQKYYKYGVFPHLFVIQIIIVIATTGEV